MKKVLYVLLFLAIAIAVLLVIGNKHITTEVRIDAPAARIWNELTAIDKYPEWNPFIRSMKGVLKKGNTIEVTFKTEGSDPVVFAPEIIRVEENTVLQWEGKLLMPGLFTGRHTFKLEAIGADATRLVQKEDFNGILVPLFNFDSTIAGFNAMNSALKKRIEGSSRVRSNK